MTFESERLSQVDLGGNRAREFDCVDIRAEKSTSLMYKSYLDYDD